MGFPGGTVDLPDGARPELAAIVARAWLDPYGDAARLVDALQGGPAEPGHLATNAWVFDPDVASVLLVRHRLLGWVNPGGHLDDGETPAAGAARELAEETGLDVPLLDARPALVRAVVLPARGPDPAHWHWNLHHLFIADPAVALKPEEGSPVDWYPFDALPTNRIADLDALLALLAPLAAKLQRA